MEWWTRRSETLRDGVGAVPIVLVFIVAQQIYGDGGSLVRAVAIVVIMGLALTVRRRWPAATFAAALLTVAVATTGLEFLAIASYTVVAHRARVRPALIAGASAVAMTVGFLQYWPVLALEEVAGDLILIAGVSVLPVAFGRSVRRARRTTAELEARNAELVALREKAAEHAVETERFRIARELHDVVAHHVSAMTVRARAGRHVASHNPQAASDSLAYIAEAGTDALSAMGKFVGALRGEKRSADPTDLAPQPGLGDIPDLLESFRGTGLVVHAELDIPPAPFSPALGLNVYRIVQEALTNAIRHGAAERAWVRVWLASGRLHIVVDDNGRGLPPHDRPTGHGLIGIAERAALHDGSSALGSNAHGGCRLEAMLTVGTLAGPELEIADAPGAGP